MANPLNRYNLGLFDSGTYSPNICDISAISTGSTTTVTTSTDHSFVIGNQVQFFIPPRWGISQLNGLKGYVIALPASDEFTVDIDSTFFNSLTVPSPSPYIVVDPAQVAGVGDSNMGQVFAGGVITQPNTIPGAFENQFP